MAGMRTAGKMVAVTKPEEKEDLENDHEMRSAFDEWAKEYGKVYPNENEREERFAIFAFTKKMVDKHNSNTVGIAFKPKLNKFSDLRSSEIKLKFGSMVCRPSNVTRYEKEVKMSYDEMSCDELKEARMDFDKWAVQHEKVYVNEADRDKRFEIFVYNKKNAAELFKKKPHYRRNDRYLENLDLMWWEVTTG